MGKRIREGKLVDDERQGHEMRSRAERERERERERQGREKRKEEVAACGCNNVGPMAPGTPGRTLYLLMGQGTALCTRYKIII
jgi:hypothetical protein